VPIQHPRSEPKPCEQCGERPAVAKGLCNRCYHAKRYREHPEVYKQSRQAWEARHREERVASARAYQAEHKEQAAAIQQDYRDRHREELRQRGRAWYAANSEKVRVRQRAWRERVKERRAASLGTNPEPGPKTDAQKREEQRAYQRAWAAANPDKVRDYRERQRQQRAAYARKYREEHKEQLEARERAWREQHHEQVSERIRAWQAANRDKINARRAERRAQQSGSNTKPLPVPRDGIDTAV